MGMATSKVRLNICGSSYVVNTSESEDYMKNLADRLNLDMNELMASSNSVSITTAAVMTALNYRDELEKASGSADNMRRQIKDYLEDAASAKMAAEEARRENASLKRRVDELERRLRGRGVAIVYISHFLEEIINTAIIFQPAGPGNMLAQVAAHGDGLLAEIELLLHDPGRTGTDNDGVDAIISDVLLDEGAAIGAAKTGVLLHVDAGIGGRILQAIHIEDFANATTSTEICTIYFLH